MNRHDTDALWDRFINLAAPAPAYLVGYLAHHALHNNPGLLAEAMSEAEAIAKGDDR